MPVRRGHPLWSLGTSAGGGTGAGSPPNVVVILADDARYDDFQQGLPSAWSTGWSGTSPITGAALDQPALLPQSVRCTTAYGEVALCAPTRASLLTGLHTGDTKVWSVNDAHNYRAFFNSTTDETNTLGTFLHSAGYQTMLAGKYMNGYESGAGQVTAGHVPPGWDVWRAFVQVGYSASEWTYRPFTGSGNGLGTDGVSTLSGTGYSTDFVTQQADAFIRGTSGFTLDPAKPIFAYLCPYAPHIDEAASSNNAKPNSLHNSDIPGSTPSPTRSQPNYNVVTTTTEQSFFAALPPLGNSGIDTQWQNRIEALRSVDDMIGAVMQALDDTGRLSNTLIIVSSDNGYCLGEHRWDVKKAVFEESMRVPLWMRWDAGHPEWVGQTYAGLINHSVDIPATILDACNVSRPQQGKSVAKMIAGGATNTYIPACHYKEGASGDPPDFAGIRSATEAWCMYQDGFIGHYDLVADQWNLANDQSPALQATAKAALAAGGICAGVNDNIPPGYNGIP